MKFRGPEALNDTYEYPCKCCEQKTYGLAKLFRCNTYKKPGGYILQAKCISLSFLNSGESNFAGDRDGTVWEWRAERVGEGGKGRGAAAVLRSGICCFLLRWCSVSIPL